MKKGITVPATVDRAALVEGAWQDVGASFERFCLTAGIATLQSMLEDDAARLCGARHARDPERAGHRWGRTQGKIGFHGGTVAVSRPRVRARAGGEVPLSSWTSAQADDWLGRWAMNLMLINVSTRKFGRAVRLPQGDVPAFNGDSRSKSAVSRRFVELSAERIAEWMASDLSNLDLLAIQIDGLHVEEEFILVAAVGIDAEGAKHPLGVVEGATENAATVQALLDNLVRRGSTLVSAGSSSSMAPRRSARPSGAPSVGTRRSSAVRCTRLEISPSACPSISMSRSGRRCARPGNWMMPTSPSA